MIGRYPLGYRHYENYENYKVVRPEADLEDYINESKITIFIFIFYNLVNR